MWVLKEDTYNYSNTLCGRIIDSLFMQTEQYSQQGVSDKQKNLQEIYCRFYKQYHLHLRWKTDHGQLVGMNSEWCTLVPLFLVG